MPVWPTGGLWRHADFLRLWSAETISQVGTQVSQLALPLAAILVLDARPLRAPGGPVGGSDRLVHVLRADSLSPLRTLRDMPTEQEPDPFVPLSPHPPAPVALDA